MKLSTRGRYGLRAMVYLAQHDETGPVSLSSIARDEDISLHYLEQLMRKLRLDGLVESTRGAHGGYSLALPAKEMPVGDILRSLEGNIHFTECIEYELCEKGDDCATRVLWERINEGILDIVDHTTLAELSPESLQGVNHASDDLSG